MKFCTVRDLRINASRVVRQARRQQVVITVRGRPTVALVPIREDDFEDLNLDHHPELRRSVYEALDEVKRTGGTPLAEVARRIKRRA